MTLCAHASCLHALILLAGPPISVSVWPEPGSHVYLSPADGARPHCSSPCVKTLMVPVVPQVVPACYRRAFPVHLKSHRSHDVVLLCFDCHEVASKAAERLKGTIARWAAQSKSPGSYLGAAHVIGGPCCVQGDHLSNDRPCRTDSINQIPTAIVYAFVQAITPSTCCVACAASAAPLIVAIMTLFSFPAHTGCRRLPDLRMTLVGVHREYGIPLTPPPVPLPLGLGQEPGSDEQQVLHPNNVRRAALALANHYATMPQARRDSLQAAS